MEVIPGLVHGRHSGDVMVLGSYTRYNDFRLHSIKALPTSSVAMYVSHGLLLAMSSPTRLNSVSDQPLKVSSSSAVVLLLLASGKVEVNPGPPRKHFISLRSLNIRSGMKKAAVLHDIISDRRLDILAIQESWIPSDTLTAIKIDIAPVGYTALHVHRELQPDGLK